MITALVSAITGMVGGVIPDLVKEYTNQKAHVREIELMRTQADLQIALLNAKTDAKLAEVEGNMVVEEVRAMRDQMKAIYEQQRPIGVKWVDAFNSMLRPTTAAGIMILFFGMASMYSYSLILQTDWSSHTSIGYAATALWSSLIGEAVQAVMGYLFGYRSTAAIKRRLAR